MWPCNVPPWLAFPSNFPFTRPACSPCPNFCQSLATCVAIDLPARHVCPFVATRVPKLPLDLPPVLYFSTWICQRSVANNVAVTFAPRHFFAIHVALNIATAIAIAITLALMVCHGYCHHV